jgi:hypothetical protein
MRLMAASSSRQPARPACGREPTVVVIVEVVADDRQKAGPSAHEMREAAEKILSSTVRKASD